MFWRHGASSTDVLGTSINKETHISTVPQGRKAVPAQEEWSVGSVFQGLCDVRSCISNQAQQWGPASQEASVPKSGDEGGRVCAP